MASLLLISTLLALSTAQTTTINLPLFGYDDMPIVASIVSANPSATTMQLACPEGTDASDCGLFPDQTLIYGPSTYHMDMAVPGAAFTMTQDCVVAASSAVCQESAGGSEANFPGSSTTTYEDTNESSVPVTVTSGADKLTASAATQATSSGAGSVTVSATTGNGPSQTTASVTGISGTRSVSVSASGSSTGSAAAQSSSGAAAANAVALGSGVFGAVGLLGGLLL